MTKVRKGMPDVTLTKAEYTARLRERFYDPKYAELGDYVDALIEGAWKIYCSFNKSPRRTPAGKGFADPSYELPIEWLESRKRVRHAFKQHKDKGARPRILLINGSPRSDQTCPGEISKTWRLVQMSKKLFEREKCDVDLLDLSRLTSEYGRVIYPCKSCVSTAMPLCHWPCSCYPNHTLGQVNDWMADIYPMWVTAHGIMIICPVQWYQVPSTFKLMMDRLVCADGGNPDPTSTKMKDPKLAKDIEHKGWDYPRHLAGRAFACVVHGDAAGPEAVADHLSHWLSDMGLVEAATLARYVGYYESYADSHEALDKDGAFQEEVRRTAQALIEKVRFLRAGGKDRPDWDIAEVRPK